MGSERCSQLEQAVLRCQEMSDRNTEFEAAAHEFLEILSVPVKEIDVTSTIDRDVQADCESLVVAAKAFLDPSTAIGQMLLDCIGLELPCIIVKYAGISQQCREMSESILRNLAEICNPRDMFAAYMEALHIYSQPEGLNLCPLLLEGLSTIFTRIQTRRPEFFREAVPGLLKTARLAIETGIETFWIFDKLMNLAAVLQDVCIHEQVEKQRKRLQQMLGVFTLLLLASSSNCQMSENSAVLPFGVVQLSKLLPSYGFSYFNLVTGSFLEDIIDSIRDEFGIVDLQLLETRRGATLAVYWGFRYEEVAAAANESIEALHLRIKSSKHTTLDALCNVKVLLVPQRSSWQMVEKGIDLLSTILEIGSVPADNSDDVTLDDWVEISLKLGSLLQVIQDVVIYSPKTKLRQQAYTTFVKVITELLPPRQRYDNLKALITNCKHPSMVSLLQGCVKEEVAKAITARQAVVLTIRDNPEDSSSESESPFASEEVLELIEFVLRPPGGGPPDLPNQTDAVLAALNLYRFLLIKETTGNSNYTGVSSKSQLQGAYSNWLLPLRDVLEGLRRNVGEDDTESTMCMLLAVDILEGVLYRCIELVEEARGHYPN